MCLFEISERLFFTFFLFMYSTPGVISPSSRKVPKLTAFSICEDRFGSLKEDKKEEQMNKKSLRAASASWHQSFSDSFHSNQTKFKRLKLNNVCATPRHAYACVIYMYTRSWTLSRWIKLVFFFFLRNNPHDRNLFYEKSPLSFEFPATDLSNRKWNPGNWNSGFLLVKRILEKQYVYCIIAYTDVLDHWNIEDFDICIKISEAMHFLWLPSPFYCFRLSFEASVNR